MNEWIESIDSGENFFLFIHYSVLVQTTTKKNISRKFHSGRSGESAEGSRVTSLSGVWKRKTARHSARWTEYVNTVYYLFDEKKKTGLIALVWGEIPGRRAFKKIYFPK